MSILHVPFYPSDWLAGTRGMSAEETGVYITIIARIYEMAGPIERDDERLSRLCGCKTKTAFKKALEYLIDEGKITECNGELSNFRAEIEIKRVVELSEKAAAAANARWNKKSNKINRRSNATASPGHTVEHPKTDAKRMPDACQPESEPEKEDTSVSSLGELALPEPKPKRGTRLPDDWVLPNDWAGWALFEGWPDAVVRLEAEKFADYWRSKAGSGATKLDWLATWRNWMRNVPKSSTRRRQQHGPTGANSELESIARAARSR